VGRIESGGEAESFPIDRKIFEGEGGGTPNFLPNQGQQKRNEPGVFFFEERELPVVKEGGKTKTTVAGGLNTTEITHIDPRTKRELKYLL